MTGPVYSGEPRPGERVEVVGTDDGFDIMLHRVDPADSTGASGLTRLALPTDVAEAMALAILAGDIQGRSYAGGVFVGAVTPTARLRAIRDVYDRIHSARLGIYWPRDPLTGGSGPECRIVPAELLSDLMSALWDAVPGVPDEEPDDENSDDLHDETPDLVPAVVGVSVDRAGRVEPLIDLGGGYAIGGPQKSVTP